MKCVRKQLCERKSHCDSIISHKTYGHKTFYFRHKNLLYRNQVREIKLEKSPFIDKFIKNMSIDHITISKRRPFAKYSFGLTKIINILYKGLNFQTLKGIESV